MEIKIDNNAIEAEINKKAAEAVVQAFGGWEVQKAIAESIKTQMAYDIVGAAAQKALSSIDMDRLSSDLAAAMSAAMVSAVRHFMTLGFANAILSMRGGPSYGPEREVALKSIVAELNAK